MDLRRLRMFLAVADHGGFTRAARATFVSQPALSLAVKEMEGELGADLFYRLGRQVTLTPAGAALVGPARQALRDLDTARAAVAKVVGLRGGSLDVCCLPTLAADPMARILGTFSRRYPEIVIELAAPDDPADLVNLLRSGRSEVGLTEAAMAGDLEHETLIDQTLVVVLPPGTKPLRQQLRLDRLGDVAWVTTPKGTSTRRLLDEAFDSVGAEPRISIVTAQREAMLPLVLSGAGAALLPEPTARIARRLDAVVCRPRPAIHRRVVLSRRPGPLAPAAAAFVELAKAAERQPSRHD
jgi:LysR family transcriptional regulator, carnitine catabolism transcriptional activator